MPGRFPLVAVPLINDPFCADGFCGAPGDVCVPKPEFQFANFTGNYSPTGLTTITLKNAGWKRVQTSNCTPLEDFIFYPDLPFSGFTAITDVRVVFTIPSGFCGGLFYRAALTVFYGNNQSSQIVSIDGAPLFGGFGIGIPGFFGEIAFSTTASDATPAVFLNCQDDEPPPPFDPYDYPYVSAAVTRQTFYSVGSLLAETTTVTTSRIATAGLLGIRSGLIPFGAEAAAPVGPSDAWEMSGNISQIVYTYGAVPGLRVFASFSDNPETDLINVMSIALTPSGPGIPPPPYPIVIATQQTVFSFYNSISGPVVATWPGLSWS